MLGMVHLSSRGLMCLKGISTWETHKEVTLHVKTQIELCNQNLLHQWQLGKHEW